MKTQLQRRPERRYNCEHFAECRDRLQEVHGWSRRKATLATRYYHGIDTLETLRDRLNYHPVTGSHSDPPELREGDVHEICIVR